MHIDWVTVLAQAVNFLILVYLLRRFLYGPITRAVADRRQRIAAAWQEADAKGQAAEAREADYRERCAELERTREQLLVEARADAEELRRSLREAAHREADHLRTQWKEEIAREQTRFLQHLRRQLAEGAYGLASQTLSALAGADLEERVVETFLAQLGGIDRDTRDTVVGAAREAGGAVVVESAFVLPASLQRRVTQAVHQHLAEGLDIEYREAAEITCGIRLTTGGQVLAWSVDAELENLASRIAASIEDLVGAEGIER